MSGHGGLNWKQSGYLFECSILRIVSLSDTHLAQKSFEKIEEEWGPEELDAHKVPQQFTTQKDVLQYAQQAYNIATDFLTKQLELAASQCEEAAENGKNDKKRANTCGRDANESKTIPAPKKPKVSRKGSEWENGGGRA